MCVEGRPRARAKDGFCELIPAAVTRVPREAGGVRRGDWVGARGGGSEGCGVAEGGWMERAIIAALCSAPQLPGNAREIMKPGVFGNARILAGKRIIRK